MVELRERIYILRRSVDDEYDVFSDVSVVKVKQSVQHFRADGLVDQVYHQLLWLQEELRNVRFGEWRTYVRVPIRDTRVLKGVKE